jgi:uncharacterized protein (DUF58 family)
MKTTFDGFLNTRLDLSGRGEASRRDLLQLHRQAVGFDLPFCSAGDAEFCGDRGSVLILVDQREGGDCGLASAELASLLAWRARERLSAVGMIVCDAAGTIEFAVDHNDDHFQRMLRLLAKISQVSGQKSGRAGAPCHMAAMLRHALRIARPGQLICLVGDVGHSDGASEGLIRELCTYNPVVVALLGVFPALPTRPSGARGIGAGARPRPVAVLHIDPALEVAPQLRRQLPTIAADENLSTAPREPRSASFQSTRETFPTWRSRS